LYADGADYAGAKSRALQALKTAPCRRKNRAFRRGLSKTVIETTERAVRYKADTQEANRLIQEVSKLLDAYLKNILNSDS